MTQQCGTEPPLQNAYWDNKKPGIYVDVVSGNLCSAPGQVRFGTGWPSFTQPLAGTELLQKEDREFGMVRTEVRSGKRTPISHLFDDGPAPTGQRYCINSASLRFVPVEKMAAEGYASSSARSSRGHLPSPDAPVKSGDGGPGGWMLLGNGGTFEDSRCPEHGGGLHGWIDSQSHL